MVFPREIRFYFYLVLLVGVIFQSVLDALLYFQQLLLGQHRLECALDLLDVGQVPLAIHNQRVLVDRAAGLIILVALRQVKVSEEVLIESFSGRPALDVFFLMEVFIIFIRDLELLQLSLVTQLLGLEVLVLLQLDLLLDLVLEHLGSALLYLLRVLIDGGQLVERVALDLLRLLWLLLCLLLLVKTQYHNELLLQHLCLLLHLSGLLLQRQVFYDFYYRIYVLGDHLGLV